MGDWAWGDYLADIRRRYGAEDFEGCTALAQDLWSRHGDEADASLGECGRFAMIAAVMLKRFDEAVVWRARACSVFARTDCRNGAALAMLPDFFMAVDRFRNDPEPALAILKAIMATIGGSDDPISSDMARGTVLEKRGFLRTRIGMERQDPGLLTDAQADYDEAMSLTADPRRKLKIRAGRTTVDFLLADTSEQRDDAILALQAIVAEAADGSFAAGVERVGLVNQGRMAAGRTDLESYEVE